MSSQGEKKKTLQERVVAAAEAALAREGHVCAIDVFTGIGWLQQSWLDQWQQGRSPFLAAHLQTSPGRVDEVMRALAEWAASKRLQPGETEYVARTVARGALRFSAAGDEAVERSFRTHWTSPELSAKAREKVAAKANRAPELVAIQALNEWKCHRCGGTGDLLFMEEPGPACLPCAGLGELEYLPAGDAGLSRRAKAASKKHAVVVRFSRTRKRYERQGLLVEPAALRLARRD